MKKQLNQLAILCCASVFMACGGNENSDPATPEPIKPNEIHGINAIVQPSASFAKDDGALKLSGSSAEKAASLLKKAGFETMKGLHRIIISEEEYKEIDAFTHELVHGLETPIEVYRQIFQWIVSNVQYASGYVDNNPYPVFKTKEAICQGYANLLAVMLHTQDIPACVANGMLNPVGGHAWNYVYLDDWYVSDPTNNGHYLMSNIGDYKHLIPMSLDVDLFEDDCFVYQFYEEKLTLRKVKKSDKQLIVPFSVEGFQIEAINPESVLPSNIEEIYIGKNVESLGENLVGLSVHAPSVKHAYVDPSNDKMESYGQIVYRNSFPYYIPASASIIQFKPIATIGKNFLKDHETVETIVFQSGTQKLESYAVENCPKLLKAYVPEETILTENAFYGVHATFQAVRGIVKD